MFVCLTAGTSVSLLLLVSSAAGGEDGTQDDSSLPTWSRKLQSTDQRSHFVCSQNRKATPNTPFVNVEFGIVESVKQAPLFSNIQLLRKI